MSTMTDREMLALAAKAAGYKMRGHEAWDAVKSAMLSAAKEEGK